MGKKKSNIPDEDHLIFPPHPSRVSPPNSLTPIVDTHTHLLSTFSTYRHKYPESKFSDVYEFVRGIYLNEKGESEVEAIVDVWCEAPIRKEWKEMADSAMDEEGRRNLWGGIRYCFVIGVHPHEAKSYTDEVEADLITALTHPLNHALGEIGLDYHYNLSPPPVQQEVFRRQLRLAVKMGKPLTVHTREAEEDTERILKEEVPRDWRIHVHCFTDSPEFAERLLDYYPNLYIGITGVITYTSNLNTAEVIRRQLRRINPHSPSSSQSLSDPPAQPQSRPKRLRILLETDAPFMVPGNIYKDVTITKGGSGGVDVKGEAKGKSAGNGGGKTKFFMSHTKMIPWTAEFVAGVAEECYKKAESFVDGTAATDGHEGKDEEDDDWPGPWTVEKVMRISRRNARAVYGV